MRIVAFDSVARGAEIGCDGEVEHMRVAGPEPRPRNRVPRSLGPRSRRDKREAERAEASGADQVSHKDAHVEERMQAGSIRRCRSRGLGT
jgi:hypothetical protein